MLASDDGELLVLDVFMEKYPVKIESQLSDQVWPSTITVMDTKGNVVTQKPFTWMKTNREWFWSVSVSQNPGPFPSDWGLVRTRYKTDGVSIGVPFASRGSEFLFQSGKDEMVIHRIDHGLKTLWKRSLQNLVAPVVSPSWASPILIHDGICQKFSTISERGTDKEEKSIEMADLYRELWKNDFKRPRFAIGQSTEGDWLLIAY
jgi:hypothetical protein